MNKIFIISVLLLASFFLLGCTQDNVSFPFTESQFYARTSDINYSLLKMGYYDGNCLSLDGNKISLTDCNSSGGSDTNIWTVGLLNDLNVWQGNFEADGNITGDYFIGDGSLLTGISGGSGGEEDLNATMGFGNWTNFDLNIFKTTPKLTLTDSGGTSKDISLEANNSDDASYVKATTGVPSANNAVYFDGTNSNWARLGAVNTLHGTNTYTIDFWVKFNAWKASSGVLATRGSNLSGLVENGAGKFSYWSNSGQKIASLPSTGLNTDTWYHFFIRSNAGIINVYVDNVLVGTGAQSNNSIDDYWKLAVDDVIASRVSNATFDEVHFWNRALSDAEKTSLYNSGEGLYGDTSISPYNSGLILGYHLDETSGALIDFSSSRINGAVNAGTFAVTGKVSTPASDTEVEIIKIQDGITGAGKGTITFGNDTSDTVLDGGKISISGNSYMPSNEYRIYQGGGNNYSQYFNGTNQLYSLTTGNFLFNTGVIATATNWGAKGYLGYYDSVGATEYGVWGDRQSGSSGGYFTSATDIKATLASGSIAGQFTNNTQTVHLADGTYAVKVITGDSYFSDDVEIYGSSRIVSDFEKSYFGIDDDASIYYDGTDLVINPKQTGSGLVYVDGNISAEGFITRTDVYDTTKEGSALDKIKDSSNYLLIDKDVNHDAFDYSKINYSKKVIDYFDIVYEDLNVWDKNIIHYWNLKGEEITEEEAISLQREADQISEDGKSNPQYTTTVEEVYKIITVENKVPVYKTVDVVGVSLDKEVALIKQAVYELKVLIGNIQVSINNILNRLTGAETKIRELETENDLIKSELCKKDSSYVWCKPIK
jgi:hypothetical protein